jgi:hypothetical protein
MNKEFFTLVFNENTRDFKEQEKVELGFEKIIKSYKRGQQIDENSFRLLEIVDED